mmetsp:Transcript_6761/g.8760  ORF Transcript_6761/g.8760 Transcript_6761/m.8760 type:complete len:693 (-) Transcript_6761:110-2188(-)
MARISLWWIVVHVLSAASIPCYFSKWIIHEALEKELTGIVKKVEKPPKREWNLPKPILHAKKTPPDYHYTGQCFDDPESEDEATKAKWSQHRVDVHMHINEDHEANLNANKSVEETTELVVEGFDGYQPAGQHLLMDIQNVDSGFLMDTERMAVAMVEITTVSALTLLSYHCHDLQPPMGVSCVGVLLESHVSLHTWPQAGIISLDLFTCGAASLLPLVPVLERLFAIPSGEKYKPEPSMRWLYKKRGYRDYHDIVQHNLNKYAESQDGESTKVEEEDKGIIVSESSIHKPQGVDLERYFLGWKGFSHKGIIANEKTEFQEVAVFEMKHSQTPLSRVQESDDWQVLKTNKKLFLDNVAQSSLTGLEAYHEAMVAPALLAHKSPKRVAIIGSGEGAALRECLKHHAVQTCTLLEIDAAFIELAKEYLQEWNDCSNLPHNEGREGYVSCFDEPRADVQNVDAIHWFIDNFGANAAVDESKKYDVIIMDAFDPLSYGSMADVLYGDEEFVEALTGALTEEGILVVQLALTREGTENIELDPVYKVLQKFANLLKSHGAISMKSYGEAHGQFLVPWDFQVVFMGEASAAAWLSETAQVDLQIAKSGKNMFQYFDGATMAAYQYPSSAQENISCDLNPELALCEQTVERDSQKSTASALLAAHNNVEVLRSMFPNQTKVETNEPVEENEHVVMGASS